MITIAILAFPARQFSRVANKAHSMGGSAIITERHLDLVHLTVKIPDDLITVGDLYSEVHAGIGRFNARPLLSNIRYKADPSCIVPRCDGNACRRLCGSDMWRCPAYYRRDPAPSGDCDCIELAAAGMGGVPVFVKPGGGGMGHVLHLNERYSSEAFDYCIPAGMKTWGGKREAFFFDNGRLVNGQIWPSAPNSPRYVTRWK